MHDVTEHAVMQSQWNFRSFANGTQQTVVSIVASTRENLIANKYSFCLRLANKRLQQHDENSAITYLISFRWIYKNLFVSQDSALSPPVHVSLYQDIRFLILCLPCQKIEPNPAANHMKFNAMLRFH